MVDKASDDLKSTEDCTVTSEHRDNVAPAEKSADSCPPEGNCPLCNAIMKPVNIIGKKYENFIEAGKRKLGFYKPEVSDTDRFLMSFLIYFMILMPVVFIADLGAQKVYEDSDALLPMQEAEADIILRVQRDVFDMPVVKRNTTLWYDTGETWNGKKLSDEDKIGGFGLKIDSACSGFHEMVFLTVLVLGFRGVPVKIRFKWAVILDIVVFIENLFRIFALYPMALYWGRDFEEWFHFYWWHYGQYMFIMTLFGLWFYFVARKYMGPDEKKDENGDGEEEKDEELVEENGDEPQSKKDDESAGDTEGQLVGAKEVAAVNQEEEKTDGEIEDAGDSGKGDKPAVEIEDPEDSEKGDEPDDGKAGATSGSGEGD